jgi:hypothetical protein
MCKDHADNPDINCLTVDLERQRFFVVSVVVIFEPWWYEYYFKNLDYTVRVGNTNVAYVNGQSFAPASWNTLMCPPKKASVDSEWVGGYIKFTIGCSNGLSGRYFTLNKSPTNHVFNAPHEVQAFGYLTEDGAQSTYYACNTGYSGPKGGPCTVCGDGTYKDTVSTAACTACPANSNSSTTSRIITDCVCNARYTGANGGPCVACVAGTFKNVSGSAACSVCPANTYSASGASSCTACPAGFQSAPGSREVADCCDPNTTFATSLYYSLTSATQAQLSTTERSNWLSGSSQGAA